jgi:hypothetical protein
MTAARRTMAIGPVVAKIEALAAVVYCRPMVWMP